MTRSAPDSPPSSSAPPSSLIITRLRSAGCVFAEDEARLLVATARTPAELATMVDRRVAGQPLEHVLGWAEFCGLRMAVGPGVFVPRRRTEFLVRQAAGLARRPRARPRRVIVDLCCGSGALGAALVASLTPSLERIELHASDIDPAAVRYARRNVAAAGGLVYEGDLFEPLPAMLRDRVDVLLANVPYVPTEEVGVLPAEARDHEPQVALDGGPDGLDVLRRVAAGAAEWLAAGGHLLFETSERQVPQAVDIVTGKGLIARVEHSAERDATTIIATRPTSPP